MKKNSLVTGCPIDTTINILKGKCKAAIVLEVYKGNNKFGLLRKNIAISEKLLSIQLSELIEDNILIKHTGVDRLESLYSLSTEGKQLVPLISEMLNWGKGYQGNI